jgi:hypothetical protein
MSKYGPLNGFLNTQTASELPMTFREVEQIIGSKLPPSAYRHRPWWANEAASHVHAKAWLSADYQTEQVDMAGKKLVFKRVRAPNAGQGGSAAIGSHGGLGESARAFKNDPSKNPATSHPMIGSLKGWLIVEPGYDLTQPAMPEWAELADKKYGPENSK